MNVSVIFTLLKRLVDTDGDGKVELSDLPGVIEKASEMVSIGESLAETGRNSIDALLDLAKRGGVTENGVPLTADDVKARWRAARSGFQSAAQRVREELAKEANSAPSEQ